MIESDHARDPLLGIPVFSLYGADRLPQDDMLELIDVLIVDLVDVGTRVYTFAWTLYYCLEAAGRTGKKVLILDRPNPIGGELVEGNILDLGWRSFVGLHPIPMRHGLTLGELGLLLNAEAGLDADLTVISMKGWQREMDFAASGLPWVFPSPNMPSPSTALVYPGQVIWEGTNISEGRGTTLPFELFGAPFLDCREVLAKLGVHAMAGCVLRPLVFTPTSNKWSGRDCHGFQIHVTNRHSFRPYRTTLALLQALASLYPDDFAYKLPPYEYEYEKLPIDCILGNAGLRQALENGADILELERSWRDELYAFEARRQKFMLYS